jgi:hypothetical protein
MAGREEFSTDSRYLETFLAKVQNLPLKLGVVFPSSMLENTDFLRLWLAYLGWVYALEKQNKDKEVPIFKDLDELLIFSEYFDLKEGVQINPDSAL